VGYRVAFASAGEMIDQHFGSARVFQVYDIDGDEYTHIDQRRTAAKCQGNCEGGFDHLLKALDDCDAVFAAKIGQGAAAFMLSRGRRVFEASGGVEEILAQLIEGDLLNES
jgi:predicted Fe-Mo cluster-binding NifX family protein